MVDQLVLRSAREGIWITRDGEVLTIEEMEDSHVFNAWRLLQYWRKQEVRPKVRWDLKSWVTRFRKELRSRGLLQ